MPADEVNQQLRSLSAQLKSLQAKFSIFESDADSMPPATHGPLFGDPTVIYGGSDTFPLGGVIIWPYELDVHPIPDGWEIATEFQEMYIAGRGVGDDYNGIGHGNNTNGFTGYDYHGDDGEGFSENNHENHILDHSHAISQSTAPSVLPGSIAIPGSEGWCAGLTVAGGSIFITACSAESSTGGDITWCNEEGLVGAGPSPQGHSLTDNRPRTFIVYFLRRKFPPEP